MKKDKGITLVALVITIIVIAIIAGIGISTIRGRNSLIKRTNDAETAHNIGAEKEEIEVRTMESFDEVEGLTITELKKNLAKISGLQILGDSFPLTVRTITKTEFTIDSEGVVEPKSTSQELEVGKISDANRTLDGEKASYKNPIIPKGFKTVDTDDAKWGSSDGYNKGLVIEDNEGNQFVWVPVDGEKLKYQKHVYETPQVDDTVWDNRFDTGNGNWATYYYRKWQDWEDNGGDKASVKKYGGFYIARFEAGIPENAPFYGNEDGAEYTKTESANTGKDVTDYIPVSKKNEPVWNYISKVNAKIVSEKMYTSNSAIKCGLIDSYAWDTVTTWMKNSGINVTNSTSWGNYYNAAFSINGLYAIHTYSGGWHPAETYSKGTHSKTNGEYAETATGIIERNKAKNIYDFAGNMYEWTTETGTRDGTVSTRAVLRGGDFSSSGSGYPACYRDGSGGESGCHIVIGFRVVLYIQ